jgi:pectinesterase
LGDGSKPIKQALAAAFYGNKTAIFNCSFLSYQYTLFAAMGRHYFKGETNFIFGAGQSYFEVKRV